MADDEAIAQQSRRPRKTLYHRLTDALREQAQELLAQTDHDADALTHASQVLDTLDLCHQLRFSRRRRD